VCVCVGGLFEGACVSVVRGASDERNRVEESLFAEGEGERRPQNGSLECASLIGCVKVEGARRGVGPLVNR
jgi:hypothetical protein